MASVKVNREDVDYRYSACQESIESTEEDSENDSGCSHFYRQTAKVRFTRTTSKIQHHIEAREADEGRQQLFGCFKRSSSTNQMSQYLERGHTKKVRLNNYRNPILKKIKIFKTRMKEVLPVPDWVQRVKKDEKS